MKSSLKMAIFLTALYITAVLCCSCQHPSDKVFDDWQLGNLSSNGQVAIVDDTVIYRCPGVTYLKESVKNNSAPEELEDLRMFIPCKISSSREYFYYICEADDINILILNKKGEIVKEMHSDFDWIYAVGDTIFGYYNPPFSFTYFVDSDDGFDRIVATHYIDEDIFLKNGDNIINWNTFEGEECIIDGIVMKRVEDFGYGEPHYYYTDVPREPFIAHNFLAVINGKISSDVDKKNTKKYMKQLNDIFGRKEKNYLLRAWQNQSKTQGVVNVYNKSDGFLQCFTKDIDYSLLFEYDSSNDRITELSKIKDKEVVYYDDKNLIYREKSKVYHENIQSKNKEVLFENDGAVWIDCSNDIITLYDKDTDGNVRNTNCFVLD